MKKTQSPLVEALLAAGFTAAVTKKLEDGSVQHGFTHTDRRAALIVCTPNGAETWHLQSGGKRKSGTTMLLLMTALTATAKETQPAAMTGSLEALPRHIVRAIEMLGECTAQQFDLDLLRGDKHYSQRLALLKKLYDRKRVLVAETTITKLTVAFYSAVGAGEGSAAKRATEFALRCKAVMSDALAAARYAKKMAKEEKIQHLKTTLHERIVAGPPVLPSYKPPTTKQRAALDAAKAEEVLALAEERAVEGTAIPSAQWPIDRLWEPDMRALELANGMLALQLEPLNSQGAVCIHTNGKRTASGVLSREELAEAKAIGMPIAELVAMLSRPGLAVTDSAKMHLAAAEARRTHDRTAYVLEAVNLDAKAPLEGRDEVVVVCGDVRLLEDPANGIVLMQLEKENSQGAICVYNNGSRVSAGVVKPEILWTLRTLEKADITKAAHQLLNPLSPSVAVTPVAARHLTAVLGCKELITMATHETAKKFATKKAAVKSTAKKAAVKTEGAPRKSSLFRLLNDTKTTWSAFTTQKAAIVAGFVKLGAVGKNAAGVTRGALIAALPDVPDKNISFYLSKWQAAGIVEKMPAAE